MKSILTQEIISTLTITRVDGYTKWGIKNTKRKKISKSEKISSVLLIRKIKQLQLNNLLQLFKFSMVRVYLKKKLRSNTKWDKVHQLLIFFTVLHVLYYVRHDMEEPLWHILREESDICTMYIM